MTTLIRCGTIAESKKLKDSLSPRVVAMTYTELNVTNWTCVAGPPAANHSLTASCASCHERAFIDGSTDVIWGTSDIITI